MRTKPPRFRAVRKADKRTRNLITKELQAVAESKEDIDLLTTILDNISLLSVYDPTDACSPVEELGSRAQTDVPREKKVGPSLVYRLYFTTVFTDKDSNASGRDVVVCWLLNVPATCWRILGTTLLRQLLHTEIEVANETVFHLVTVY